MIRFVPLLLLAATPAMAAERSFAIASFERIRVEGPFDVRLTTGRSPVAKASGTPAALESLDIDVQGTTLTVRNRNAAGPVRQGPAAVVTLFTPRLTAANVFGGGTLAVSGPVQAERVDLSVSGSGSLSANGIDTGRLNATLIGTGTMTLGGRAGRVQLGASGAGGIDAARLTADDLTIRTDGTGATSAAARYTADVATAGIGGVTVLGTPACKIKATGGGPVKCGR